MLRQVMPRAVRLLRFLAEGLSCVIEFCRSAHVLAKYTRAKIVEKLSRSFTLTGGPDDPLPSWYQREEYTFLQHRPVRKTGSRNWTGSAFYKARMNRCYKS